MHPALMSLLELVGPDDPTGFLLCPRRKEVRQQVLPNKGEAELSKNYKHLRKKGKSCQLTFQLAVAWLAVSAAATQ